MIFSNLINRIWTAIVRWLNTETNESRVSDVIDFDLLMKDAQPGDVILFEGRSRISEVIKLVTASPWTHSAMYVGSINDIEDESLREKVMTQYDGDHDEPLVIESLLGFGTILNPLSRYKHEHLRVCRPVNLPERDQQRIVPFAMEHLGMDYDVRQLLDLARFMFPWCVLPRRWRSSLFRHNAGKPTHIVCSSMIARCFEHVDYPVLPIVERGEEDRVNMYHRNFKLYVPGDFDYSPFFEVIKYPGKHWLTGIAGKNLPWQQQAQAHSSGQKAVKKGFSLPAVRMPGWDMFKRELSRLTSPTSYALNVNKQVQDRPQSNKQRH